MSNTTLDLNNHAYSSIKEMYKLHILTHCDVATCRLSCFVKAITGDLNIKL